MLLFHFGDAAASFEVAFGPVRWRVCADSVGGGGPVEGGAAVRISMPRRAVRVYRKGPEA